MGTQGAVAVQYTGQLTQLSLNVNHLVLPSGLGGFVTVDQASGNYSYTLSERSSTGINLQWQKSHSDAIDNTRTTSGVWLQNDLSYYWRLRTYYLHNLLYGAVVGTASSNILGVTFTYTHADF